MKSQNGETIVQKTIFANKQLAINFSNMPEGKHAHKQRKKKRRWNVRYFHIIQAQIHFWIYSLFFTTHTVSGKAKAFVSICYQALSEYFMGGKMFINAICLVVWIKHSPQENDVSSRVERINQSIQFSERKNLANWNRFLFSIIKLRSNDESSTKSKYLKNQTLLAFDKR